MQNDEQEEHSPPQRIELAYRLESGLLLADITGFVMLVHSCFENISKAFRKAQIQKILTSTDWREHYKDSKTQRRVLSHSAILEHKHEKDTAILLAQADYVSSLCRRQCSSVPKNATMCFSSAM